MDSMVELANVEIHEYCMLNKLTGEKNFSKVIQIPGFTGLYFRDSANFFALYPTTNGPVIFFEGKEYEINENLTISLTKHGKNRRFNIIEYDIEVNYIKSIYNTGFDVWSTEMDVDLFFMISKMYKDKSFYERYTLA
jgi:hypothetical protein